MGFSVTLNMGFLPLHRLAFIGRRTRVRSYGKRGPVRRRSRLDSVRKDASGAFPFGHKGRLRGGASRCNPCPVSP